jgi:hypothetical protein
MGIPRPGGDFVTPGKKEKIEKIVADPAVPIPVAI